MANDIENGARTERGFERGPGYFEHRRLLQQRLVDVGYRISRAAAEACRAAKPSLPIIIEHSSQFAPEVLPAAGFGPKDVMPRVAAVAVGSPAARAGLMRGDALVLWSSAVPQMERAPSFAAVERAVGLLETRETPQTASNAERTVPVTVARGDGLHQLAVPLEEGCGIWFDLSPADRVNAASTTRWVQLSEGMMRLLDGNDDGLAFVIAHEFGHRVLRLRSGGAGAICSTRCEQDADRLGLLFVAKAGFSVDRAPDALRAVASAHHALLDWRSDAVRARAADLQALIAASKTGNLIMDGTYPAPPALHNAAHGGTGR